MELNVLEQVRLEGVHILVSWSFHKVRERWNRVGGGRIIYSDNYDKIEHPKDVVVKPLKWKYKPDEAPKTKKQIAKEKEEAEREARANYWKAYFTDKSH